MQWTDVLQDPALQDLPYKIELNAWGQIVMTPASTRHATLQGRMALRIGRLMGSGEVLTECPIETDTGVKVADVAWCSDAFLQEHRDELFFTSAPEICVEVVSPSNSDRQMQEKMALYFNRGAKECWLVTEDGLVRFFDSEGEREKSSFGVEVCL